jgi:hypothetical protein
MPALVIMQSQALAPPVLIESAALAICLLPALTFVRLATVLCAGIWTG